MVTKLNLLGIILLLSLTTFSQKDTSKIILPYHVAKLVAIDLVQGDSVKAELIQTKQILQVTQEKIKAQDTIIVSFEKKEILHKSEIKILGLKEETHKEKIKELKSTNEDLVKKNNRLKTTAQMLGGGLIGTLAILVAFIAIK
jgi:3-dehydroquinate synthetase